MPSELPRYTLRIPREYLDKIHYIAEENGRSANREIELLIKKRIEDKSKEGRFPRNDPLLIWLPYLSLLNSSSVRLCNAAITSSSTCRL